MAASAAARLQSRRGSGRYRPLWVRSFSYWAYQYKRTWKGSITVSVLEPVLYLASMGIGLGTLIDHHVGDVGGVSYLRFVGPGLLAAAVMQVATTMATWPIMGAIKWMRTYWAMLATPIRVIDVLIGHLAWMAVRLSIVSGVFLGILAAFGLVDTWEAVLALPAGVLTGLAFCMPLTAYAATQEKDTGFSTIYRFVVVPLFLFSGTFFPISELPGWLQPVAYATPLYHGVALCRALVLGDASLSAALEHVAYLIVLSALGLAIAVVTYRRRLVV